MELPSRSWKITKYARFIPDKSTSFVRTGGPPAGSWRQYGDKEIRLLLVSDQQLIVQSGADILESLCLWNARSWLNCLAKGDSLAFVSKKEGIARRFKVQFSTDSSLSGEAQCRSCTDLLEPHVGIQYRNESRPDAGQGEHCQQQNTQTMFSQSLSQLLSSQGQETGTCLSDHGDNAVSVSALADATLGHKRLPMSTAYANTDYPTEQLSSFIQLCLTDPNFPAFVEKVEEELKKITN